MSKYFFVQGFYYPFWATYERSDGQGTEVHNLEADTDMGDLALEEFESMFGSLAVEITEEQYHKSLARVKEIREQGELIEDMDKNHGDDGP